MQDLFSKIQQELAAGRGLCLATIVGQMGSAPRSVGTSFLVLEDGGIWGTIGGGLLEAQVMEAAGQALGHGRAQFLEFHLSGQDAAQSQMICGGQVQVYLEPQTPADHGALEFWGLAAAAARQATAGGGGALMATRLSPGPLSGLAGRRFLWQGGGLLWPPEDGHPRLPGELLSNIEVMFPKGRPWLWAGGVAGGRENFFLEPITVQPVVYICGGGHISLCLAPLVKLAGFDLVVIDDRPEFADARRFAMADHVLVRGFAGVFQGLDIGPQSYMVIVTRGHLHDKEVLAQALGLPAAYVGMIGSRRKRQLIYQALEEEGFGPERLAAVHSPIGLDIGAETPEEIAISIVAELIKVRAALSGQRRIAAGCVEPLSRSLGHV
ncbi:MAG: XdhC family protein [Desulfarculus sp.]|nr:XdhC family protein [Desulfarculus sp.]